MKKKYVSSTELCDSALKKAKRTALICYEAVELFIVFKFQARIAGLL